jgi:hypothetical protein
LRKITQAWLLNVTFRKMVVSIFSGLILHAVYVKHKQFWILCWRYLLRSLAGFLTTLGEVSPRVLSFSRQLYRLKFSALELSFIICGFIVSSDKGANKNACVWVGAHLRKHKSALDSQTGSDSPISNVSWHNGGFELWTPVL